MIWLYLTFAVLLGLPTTMFIAGLFLPERYEARIVVTLDRAPEIVWAALMDYQANPVTGSMRKRTESLSNANDLPSWKEDMGSSQVIVTTESSSPPTHLKRRFVDTVVPMTAEWEIVLEFRGDGCRATATNTTVIKSGTWHVPFFRVMLGLFGGATMGLRAYWKSLAKNLGANLRFE